MADFEDIGDIETPQIYGDAELPPPISPPTNPRPSRRKIAIIALISLAALALIVGLSVGLTQRDPHYNPSNLGDGGKSEDGSGDTTDETKDDTIEETGKKDEDTKDTTSSPGSDNGDKEGTTTNQEVAQLLFQPNLRSFSADVLQGYNNCNSLIDDIEEAGKYLVNLIISMNIRYGEEEVIALDGDLDRGAQKSASSASSYETNNQVEGVDEADIVKSDGTNVFLAYGNELVWMLTSGTTNGTVVSRFEIPLQKGVFPDISHWDVTPAEHNNDKDGGSTIQDGEDISISSFRMDWWAPPAQKIKGLLLNKDTNELVVIVSYYTYFGFKFIGGEMTSSFTYSFKNGSASEKPSILLTNQLNHKGRYETARFIDGNVHIITQTNINNYPLQEALSKSNFPGTDDDGYRTAALNRASLLLPKYSRQLLAELISDSQGMVDTSSCSRIVGVSDMADVIPESGEVDYENDPTSGTGLINGFASTSSFVTGQSDVVVSGAFLPAYDLEVYANGDHLVFAGKGWLRDPATFSYLDYTYLIRFGLNGAVTRPTGVGKVKGRFLNQFSIDQYGDYLRVATTMNAKWEYDDKQATWVQVTPSSSQIYILGTDDSSGNNGAGVLKEVAVLDKLGVNEDIYSVRFFEDKAFVVTFRRIDPFYTIDLSDPKNPTVAGELKIPGYSNYLHLIENNQYVLAVGQHANETTGRNLGLQISLFDVSDFSNPQRVHNTVIEGWSWSDAQGDHLAFRYFDNTLILPVEVKSGSQGAQYDGFYVYGVTVEDGIVARGKVTHATYDFMRGGCWSQSYVPSRSMVFEGQLMTMKGHVVILSDGLDSPSELWSLNLDQNKNSGTQTCFPWFAW